MQTNTIEPRVSAGKLAWGLVLIFVGGYAFVEAIDLWSAREIWRLWPLGLIVLGLANAVDAIRARKGDGSYILLGIGVWMLAGTQHWLGMSVRSAFPLAMIIAGLGVVLHAFIDEPAATTTKENDDECC